MRAIQKATVKVGAITVGQSPRVDITEDILPILGEDIQLIERGALDGITPGEIEEIQPEEGDYVLISRMTDGSQVRFAERKILSRIQRAIEDLEEQGVSCILMLCTGKFPDVFHAKVPLLYPFDLLGAVVPVLTGNESAAVIVPDRSQIKQCKERWARMQGKVKVVSGSPYLGMQEVESAARQLQDWQGSLIVMDCMGYSQKMKEMVQSVTGKPVILPRTLLARIAQEYAVTVKRQQ